MDRNLGSLFFFARGFDTIKFRSAQNNKKNGKITFGQRSEHISCDVDQLCAYTVVNRRTNLILSEIPNLALGYQTTKSIKIDMQRFIVRFVYAAKFRTFFSPLLTKIGVFLSQYS